MWIALGSGGPATDAVFQSTGSGLLALPPRFSRKVDKSLCTKPDAQRYKLQQPVLFP